MQPPPLPSPFSILSITLLLLHPLQILAQCYRPDNIPWTADNDYSQCPQNNMCCALGRPTPPGADDQNGTVITRDTCLPNGLCENRYMRNGMPGRTTWWRDFCTDGTWSDNATCLGVCVEESLRDGYRGNIELTPCDDTASSEKWCCGDTKSCCNDDRAAVIILPTLGMSRSSSMASMPSSTTSSTTPQSSASATGTGSTTNGGLSGGAKAGIAVGVAAGALAMLGLGYLIARSRNKGKTEGDQDKWDPASKYGAYAFSAPAQEMDGRVEHELAAARPDIELPAPRPNIELP